MNQIGIIGTASFYGPHYATLVANRNDTTVSGIVRDAEDEELQSLNRPTGEKLRHRHGCPLYDSVSELLSAKKLDGIVIASPTRQRANDAVAVLKEGIPVLTAKPAADSSDAAHRIAVAAENADIPALTTSPARFDRAIRELHTRVTNGEIGDVLAIDVTIRHDRVPAAGIEANAEHASGEAGAVFAMGYYTADLLEWLGGTVTQVSGELTNANSPHSEHPDLGAATATLENGAIATMRLQYATDCREPLGNWEVEVVGSEGIVRTAHQGYEGIQWTAGAPEARSVEVFSRIQSRVLEAQLETFIDAIETGSSPAIAPDPSTVVSSLEICEAWRRAANLNEAVTL
jgi:predicted dehydrogenase